MITFEYNGKIYKPSNLENKLKNLGITINDIKIISDTKTNAEKAREERIQQIQNVNSDKKVDVYWDKCTKGWYIFDRKFPYDKKTRIEVLGNIMTARFISIGENINQNDLTEFFKENFQKVIKNNF